MTEATRDQQQRLAFDHYVVPVVPVLYRDSLSLTGRPAGAEDLTRDTLSRVLTDPAAAARHITGHVGFWRGAKSTCPDPRVGKGD